MGVYSNENLNKSEANHWRSSLWFLDPSYVFLDPAYFSVQIDILGSSYDFLYPSYAFLNPSYVFLDTAYFSVHVDILGY